MSWAMDFQDKRVLVTAGIKGIGKVTIGLFKQLGARDTYNIISCSSSQMSKRYGLVYVNLDDLTG
ncbi:hypothetical protein ACUY4R_003222 [Kosakonia sp. BK9b]